MNGILWGVAIILMIVVGVSMYLYLCHRKVYVDDSVIGDSAVEDESVKITESVAEIGENDNLHKDVERTDNVNCKLISAKNKPLYFDKIKFVITVISFVCSIAILLYSVFKNDSTFMQATVNSLFFMWLSILAYVDYKEKIIPNAMVLTGMIVWVVVALMDVLIAKTSVEDLLTFSGIGAIVSGGFLLLIAILMKSSLGMGDVKMFTVIGLYYGLSSTYSILLFSLIIMAVVSVVLLILKKVTKKTAVPMAPFVLIGFLINVLAGV